jgi:hypothetical protein
MILAHIAGVPFEEWLGPAAVSGYYAYAVARAVEDELTARDSGCAGAVTPATGSFGGRATAAAIEA